MVDFSGGRKQVHTSSKEQEQFDITIDGRWITHNYVLHSMSADFELGVADFGVALAAATAASSGHWMDQILKTHCSLLIYESDYCKTSIFDVHRSCPSCHYDLCLQCCQELRDGNLHGNKEEVFIEFKDSGLDYFHGGKSNLDESNGSMSAGDPAPKEQETHDLISATNPAPKGTSTHDGLSAAETAPKEQETYDSPSAADLALKKLKIHDRLSATDPPPKEQESLDWSLDLSHLPHNFYF
ncbi:hypothetical protein Tco_0089438 [Tanacetum coccineum]